MKRATKSSLSPDSSIRFLWIFLSLLSSFLFEVRISKNICALFYWIIFYDEASLMKAADNIMPL